MIFFLAFRHDVAAFSLASAELAWRRDPARYGAQSDESLALSVGSPSQYESELSHRRLAAEPGGDDLLSPEKPEDGEQPTDVPPPVMVTSSDPHTDIADGCVGHSLLTGRQPRRNLRAPAALPNDHAPLAFASTCHAGLTCLTGTQTDTSDRNFLGKEIAAATAAAAALNSGSNRVPATASRMPCVSTDCFRYGWAADGSKRVSRRVR